MPAFAKAISRSEMLRVLLLAVFIPFGLLPFLPSSCFSFFLPFVPSSAPRTLRVRILRSPSVASDNSYSASVDYELLPATPARAAEDRWPRNRVREANGVKASTQTGTGAHRRRSFERYRRSGGRSCPLEAPGKHTCLDGKPRRFTINCFFFFYRQPSSRKGAPHTRKARAETGRASTLFEKTKTKEKTKKERRE